VYIESRVYRVSSVYKDTMYTLLYVHDTRVFIESRVYRVSSVYKDTMYMILHTHYVQETTDDTLYTLVYTHYVHETLVYMECT